MLNTESIMGYLVKDDKKMIAALLGVNPVRLNTHGSELHMRLSGRIKVSEVKYFSWVNIKHIVNGRFGAEVKYLSECTEILEDLGYKIDFHYSDQNDYAVTMILRRVCPCCGRY